MDTVVVIPDVVTLDDLTTCQIKGEGVFDKLMLSVNLQLSQQVKNGIITKDQFAQVYSQITVQVLNSSIQFLTAIQQAELLRQQIISEQKKQEVLDEQAKGLRNDAYLRFTKPFTDAWSVRKTNDPDGTLVDDRNKLIDDNVGIALTAAANNLGITLGYIKNPVLHTTTLVDGSVSIFAKLTETTSTVNTMYFEDAEGTVVHLNPTVNNGVVNVPNQNISALKGKVYLCLVEATTSDTFLTARTEV